MTRHRLFVALALPRPVREALLAAMGGIAGARWQDDGQLHCTVRFLGELDPRVADEVVLALTRIRHPPIAAALGEIGAFERDGRIDTLWAGVNPRETLLALHAKVGRALAGTGIGRDPRAYRPHVTIARFGRAVAPPHDGVAAIVPPRADFTFEELRLYESMLGSGGAHYEIVERYPLR